MHDRGCTTEPLHFVLHKQTNFFKTLISLRHSDNRHSSPSVQKSNDIVLYSQKNPNTFPRPLRVYMIQSWLTLLTSLPIFSFLLILLAVPWTHQTLFWFRPLPSLASSSNSSVFFIQLLTSWHIFTDFFSPTERKMYSRGALLCYLQYFMSRTQA